MVGETLDICQVEVKSLPFINRKQTAINSITFLSITELSSSMMQDQPLLSPGDKLWAAGWMIKAKDPKFQHSNWNDWMKRIHVDDAKLSTQMNFLPVIEGDPNDHRTIFTTLKECMQISGDKVTIVTFDLPICLKAVDIIKQENPSFPSFQGWVGFTYLSPTSGPWVISWLILDY